MSQSHTRATLVGLPQRAGAFREHNSRVDLDATIDCGIFYLPGSCHVYHVFMAMLYGDAWALQSQVWPHSQPRDTGEIEENIGKLIYDVILNL